LLNTSFRDLIERVKAVPNTQQLLPVPEPKCYLKKIEEEPLQLGPMTTYEAIYTHTQLAALKERMKARNRED
jgi:hypothetical protein